MHNFYKRFNNYFSLYKIKYEEFRKEYESTLEVILRQRKDRSNKNKKRKY